MAKFTKAAVRADATARAKLVVFAEGWEQWDYAQRTRATRELALTAATLVTQPPTGFLPVEHFETYRAAFELAVGERLNEAFRKIRQAEQEAQEKRRRFAEARRWMTVKQAGAKLREFVESFHLRGLRPLRSESWGEYVSIEVERAWAVSVNVYFKWESDYKAMVRNPDDERQAVMPMRFSAEVSWSSTGRSVEQALACIALYREVTEMAAEAMAVFGAEHVGIYHGPAEEVTEPEAPASADRGIAGAL